MGKNKTTRSDGVPDPLKREKKTQHLDEKTRMPDGATNRGIGTGGTARRRSHKPGKG